MYLGTQHAAFFALPPVSESYDIPLFNGGAFSLKSPAFGKKFLGEGDSYYYANILSVNRFIDFPYEKSRKPSL